MTSPRLTRGLSLLGLLVLAGAASLACYIGPTPSGDGATTQAVPTEPGSPGAERDDDGEDVPGQTPGPKGQNAAPTGLPCDVQAVLEAKCQRCHAATQTKLPPLVTYEDLVAPSEEDATKSVAARSLELMRAKMMPPAKLNNPATAADLGAFEAWIAKGLPAGTCAPKPVPADAGAKPTTPPPTTPAADGGLVSTADAGPQTVCTSGLTWTGGPPSSRMNPGRACIACHTKISGAPIVQIGGTVYPSLNEADKCYGVQVPAYVVVKDATGRSVTLSTGATGNFSLSTTVAPLVYPITVKVVRNGKTRVMQSSPPHGDCNACHTATGDKGAPGRILEP